MRASSIVRAAAVSPDDGVVRVDASVGVHLAARGVEHAIGLAQPRRNVAVAGTERERLEERDCAVPQRPRFSSTADTSTYREGQTARGGARVRTPRGLRRVNFVLFWQHGLVVGPDVPAIKLSITTTKEDGP